MDKNNNDMEGHHSKHATKDLIDILRPEFRQFKERGATNKVHESPQYHMDYCSFPRGEAKEEQSPAGDKVEEEVDKEAKKKPGRHIKLRVFPEVSRPEVPNETPQEKALRNLRSRISLSEGHSVYGPIVSMKDRDLLLWLDAYDLNVMMTEAKIKKHLELRKREKMDDTLNQYEPPSFLKTYYPGGLCGISLDKSLVVYEMFGRLQMRKLTVGATRAEIRQFILYRWEHIRQKVEKDGASQVVMIVDMEGVSKRSLAGCVMQIWREIVELFQENYMWLVKEIIVLRCVPLSQEIYLSLRPYLSRKLMSKVTPLGINFLKFLCQRVARHEIPAFLGGYKCDVDNNPYCKEELNWNYDVPTWTHITNPFSTAEVEKLVILAGERTVKDYNVSVPDSRMLWQFLSLNQPVQVSLYTGTVHKKNCVEKLEVDPGASHATRPREILCHRAGRYTLIFDNWKQQATTLTGVLRVLLSPPNYITSKYATRIPLGTKFDLSKPITKEEKTLRRGITLNIIKN